MGLGQTLQSLFHTLFRVDNFLFVLLLYVPQLWSRRDGQFTLPHFFLGKLEQAVNQYFVHILWLVTETKLWDKAGTELATPGSAVRLASVARHVTDQGSIKMDHVITESCYKGTILYRNYWKMTILWSFSYNCFVKFHIFL